MPEKYKKSGTSHLNFPLRCCKYTKFLRQKQIVLKTTVEAGCEGVKDV